MNLERIRERFAGGFRPFAIRTSRGERYEIRQPGFMAVGREVVVVLGRDDSVTTIDALHIVAVEDLPRSRPGRAG